MNTADKDALHAAIACAKSVLDFSLKSERNLPVEVPGHVLETLHAAAELVSASLVAPQEVRMLTMGETYRAWDEAGCPLVLPQFRLLVDAAIEQFCRVNGLSIKEQHHG